MHSLQTAIVAQILLQSIGIMFVFFLFFYFSGTPDRSRDRSADREWKHDMYDSLQVEEEQPHSTTLST